MEGSVSNLEVCNFAYAGKFDQLKESILSDKLLATKTDQVRRIIKITSLSLEELLQDSLVSRMDTVLGLND